MKEIEVKLRVSDRAAVLHRVAELGWRARQERELEQNYVYDKPDGSLRASGGLLRVRDWAGICLLTLKLAADDAGPHKVKEELEVEVSDSDDLRGILAGLGFVLTWRYEKYRTHFESEGEAGVIVFDETPIGEFLELEGEPDWIDRMAADLGFSSQDYVTDTYGALFEEYREQNPRAGRHMVFSRSG